MNIKEHDFSGNMKALGASDNYVTLDENTNQIVLCKLDVIALAKHFKLTADDIS